MDEFEKVADPSVASVIGKATDREMNYNFREKYLDYRLDLSNCLILLTGNYMDKIEQYIKDRSLVVQIELLT